MHISLQRRQRSEHETSFRQAIWCCTGPSRRAKRSQVKVSFRKQSAYSVIHLRVGAMSSTCNRITTETTSTAWEPMTDRHAMLRSSLAQRSRMQFSRRHYPPIPCRRKIQLRLAQSEHNETTLRLSPAAGEC